MPLRALKNKFENILNSGNVILTEDYGELSPEAQKKNAPKMMVRTFRLEEFKSEERRVGKECRSRWSRHH